MPPVIPAAKFRPVGPKITTVPPVMYSQPWSPHPWKKIIGILELYRLITLKNAQVVTDLQIWLL